MPPASSPGFSLARRLRNGEVVHTGWCGLPYPIVAEVVAREGFSAVTLDAQHGLWDMNAIPAGIAQVRQAGAAALVRIPVGGYATASRALDFGAEGIIAPMINTPQDARAYVSFAKFPPVGERSWGPHRAMMLAGLTEQKAYLEEANAATVTFAMIETQTALDNVEAIAATPGIDALFLGPSDLSIALSKAARSILLEPKSIAPSSASPLRRRKSARSWAPTAIAASARQRWPNAACVSSRWRAI